MPAMSPTMTEGGITSWKKKEGESYSAGDVLLEIVGHIYTFIHKIVYTALRKETDKATIDVEAQEDGVLAKIIVGDGSKNIAVGNPIAIVAEEGDDLSGADALAKDTSGASTPKKEDPAPQKDTPPPSNLSQPGDPGPQVSSSEFQTSTRKPVDSDLPKGGRIFVSPVAKKIALERGIPLAKVKGSGPEGRIVRSDVEAYRSEAATTSTSTTAAQPTSLDPPYTEIPVSNMRRTIGQRLTQSKQEVPHYYVTIDVDMGRLLKLREVFNQKLDKADKLSVNDFIVKACALALRDVPQANVAWFGETIRQYVYLFLLFSYWFIVLQIFSCRYILCCVYSYGSYYSHCSRCYK